METKVETEKCVTCGTDTEIPITRHIEFRQYCVEGAGQLCAQCWDKVYSK